MEQRSFFGLSEHLERITKIGDPQEVLEATVDLEYFRGWLVEGLGYSDGFKGWQPPFDPVSMFKALILQALTATEIFLHAELESSPDEDGLMKRARFTEEQIIAALRDHEAGAKLFYGRVDSSHLLQRIHLKPDCQIEIIKRHCLL